MFAVELPNTLETVLLLGGVLALMGAWGVGRFNRRLHEQNRARRKTSQHDEV